MECVGSEWHPLGRLHRYASGIRDETDVTKIERERGELQSVTRGDPNPVNRAFSFGFGSFRGGLRDDWLLGGGAEKGEAWSIVRRGIR